MTTSRESKFTAPHFAQRRSDNPVDIAIIGASGRVGGRVVELIGSWRNFPRLSVVVAANSTRGVLAQNGIPALHVPAALSAAGNAGGRAFAATLACQSRLRVVLDCTASEEIAQLYPQWLHAGIDVVTPNKCGPAADGGLIRAIDAASKASGARLYCSTTVGAQLPLLPTLHELRLGGDRIESFEAVLSGTLSFVLGRVHQGVALSSAVREAVALGYAEPDPSGDLSGVDAARKLVILLRAIGHEIELVDIERVPLVDCSASVADKPNNTLNNLVVADEHWRARAAIAETRRERWVYRASFENGRARVAPERLPATHPLANLAPCENALRLKSAYYSAAPLTIAGPGAGVELTAAGVFADLLAAAQRHVSIAPRTIRDRAEAVAAVA